jgi:hypothetical protein
MRGSKAKRLRKAIFGDDSIRDRKYGSIGHRIKRMVTVQKDNPNHPGHKTGVQEMHTFEAQEIRCLGKRAEYQAAKRGA